MADLLISLITENRNLVNGAGFLMIVLVMSGLVVISMPDGSDKPNAILRLRDDLGMGRIHPALFLATIFFWVALALLLVIGLFGLLIQTLTNAEQKTHLFYILRLAGLTTVLGAVIALPFTVIRLRLSREQTETAQDSLFNEKINAATQGLYARRQVTRDEGKAAYDVWQDDIVQRCAAIDRLEGLADENKSEIPRIARLLSVYVRELSRGVPATSPPDDATPTGMREWAANLLKPGSDMEKAAQTLGRLTRIAPVPLHGGEVDLRNANLQRCDLQNANFENALFNGAQLQGADFGLAQLQGADFGEAQLQGANLGEAQLQGADLGGAQLQGADLWEAQLQRANLGWAQLQGANLWGAQSQGADFGEAQLQGANLWGAQLQGADFGEAQLQGANLGEAQLQGADLGEAQLQGANLGWAQFDHATSLTGATLRGAPVKDVDFTNVPQIMDYLDEIFGDASVSLPNGIGPDHKDWPGHWAKEELEWGGDFETQWRTWQATLPEGWDKDIPKP